MSEIVIFNKSDNSFLLSCNGIPSDIYKDETKYVIAKVPEGEVFDLAYTYTHKDGVAIKGDLAPVDKDAEKKTEPKAVEVENQKGREDQGKKKSKLSLQQLLKKRSQNVNAEQEKNVHRVNQK